MDRNARRLVTLSLALTAGACARGAPLGDAAPAHALAAAAATGALAPERLACVVEGAPMVVDHVVADVPELRRRRQAAVSQQLRTHARSVQDNMAQADIAYAAAHAAVQWNEMAIAAHARGDDLAGAEFSAYAGQITEIAVRAGASPGLLVAGQPADRVGSLDDEGLDFLVRYARLRADLAAGREPLTDERRAQLEAWDRDRPEIMNAYAEIVLRMYDDPYLPCPGGG